MNRVVDEPTSEAHGEAWLREALGAYPIRDKRVAVVTPGPEFTQSLCQEQSAKCTTLCLDDAALDLRPAKILTVSQCLSGGVKFDAAVAGLAVSRAGITGDETSLERDGDFRALNALAQIIEPDGLLFLTVPLGNDDASAGDRRTYGTERGPLLLRGWEVLGSAGYDRRQRHRLNETSKQYEPVLVLRNRSQTETLLLQLPEVSEPIVIDGGIRTQLIFDLAIAPTVEKYCAEGEIVTARVQTVASPLKLRARTSDLKCFNEIVLAGDYDFDLPPMDPKFIIDGGANVGYSSVLFASRYPDSKVVAIEPEHSNFVLLSENVAGYANIDVYHSAIWNRPTRLKIRDTGTAHWSFQVEETDVDGCDLVPALTLGDLLAQSGRDEIDLLKLDVEGAEKTIFSGDHEAWLPRTRVMFIELHDDIPGCAEAFFAAVQKCDFQIIERKGRYARNLCLIRTDLL